MKRRKEKYRNENSKRGQPISGVCATAGHVARRFRAARYNEVPRWRGKGRSNERTNNEPTASSRSTQGDQQSPHQRPLGFFRRTTSRLFSRFFVHQPARESCHTLCYANVGKTYGTPCVLHTKACPHARTHSPRIAALPLFRPTHSNPQFSVKVRQPVSAVCPSGPCLHTSTRVRVCAETVPTLTSPLRQSSGAERGVPSHARAGVNQAKLDNRQHLGDVLGASPVPFHPVHSAEGKKEGVRFRSHRDEPTGRAGGGRCQDTAVKEEGRGPGRGSGDREGAVI